MKLKLYSISALLGAGLLITTSANAQWTTSGTVIRPTDTTKTVSVGTKGNGNSTFYVEKQTGAATITVRSLSGNASMIIDKSSASGNAYLAYRTNKIAKWQTGMFTNENYSIKNYLTGTNPMVITQNDYVGIGTATPTYTLDVQGKTVSPSFYNINSKVNYVGTSDIRGIESYSVTADGWGLGIEAAGGFYGGLFNGYGGTYTGGVYGVYGSATGTAGTRYGVYGTASNTGGPAWAGYFTGNTYAGNLCVGTTTASSGYTLTVGGKIIATEVRVQLMPFPDYVFDKNYKLRSVYEVEEFINQYKHLPGMPTACDVEDNGMAVGEMQGKLVEKVEEQTLYIIQMQKQIDELKKEIQALKK
ncbi:MAG: hypothetical protein ABI723_18840 [Bacteroidia bacterium]